MGRNLKVLCSINLLSAHHSLPNCFWSEKVLGVNVDVDVMMSGSDSFLHVPQKGPCGGSLRPEDSFMRQIPSMWRT